MFLALLRPKQREQSSNVLDAAGDRRTEHNSVGHDKRM
jgi:hypothetical protein